MHCENLSGSIYEAIWEMRFKSLCRFYQLNHRYPTRGEAFEGFQLGNWLRLNRRLFERNKLAPNRARHMASLKYLFCKENGRRDKLWIERLQLLKAFKQEYGRWPRNKDSYCGTALGAWMYHNRAHYYRKKLPPNRLQMLLEAGYVFKPLRPIDKQWEDYFGYLKVYIERHPECWNEKHKVFPRAKRLRAWCLEMRKRYIKGTLKSEYRERLESVGFPFVKKVNRRERFERQLQAYAAFKRENPQAKVTRFTEYPPGNALGRWCAYVRHHSRSAFPEDLVSRLDELGFDWAVYENKWEANYFSLIDFFRTHSRLPSQPKSDAPHEGRLHSWLRVQKKLWLQKKLSEKKKNRLRPFLQKNTSLLEPIIR